MNQLKTCRQHLFGYHLINMCFLQIAPINVSAEVLSVILPLILCW